MSSIASPRLNRLPVEQRGLTIADFLLPIRVGERMSIRLRHLALVALGTALISVSAWISIPLPFTPVPISGQTFGVLLVGGALGFRRGLLAITLYVLLGVVGLPFFAEGKGGLIVIWGATGGYLIGFVVAGAVVGRLTELGWDRHIGGALGAMLIGSVLIYVVGLPWLMVVTGSSPAETIDQGLRPYLVGDAIKLALAAVIFPSAWWFVGRRPDDR